MIKKFEINDKNDQTKVIETYSDLNSKIDHYYNQVKKENES